MTDFQLQPGGLVSTGELAALVARADGRQRGLAGPELEAYVAEHKVSDQTIRNYIRRGVVKPAQTDGRRMLFDPDVAVGAVLANRPERRHGGRRRGSGRRKSTPQPAGAFRAAADYREAVDRIVARADEGVRPVQALPAEALLNLTADELRALLAHADPVGITPACLDRLETTLKIKALERKQAAEDGKLMEAEAARKAWAETLRGVKTALDGLPARVSDRVAMAAWVSPETVDRLVADLHAAGVAGAVLDRVRETLAPPAELVARVRVLIADEVRGVSERLAGG